MQVSPNSGYVPGNAFPYPSLPALNLDGAIQITKGRYFWPLDPRNPRNVFDIEFIAHALSTAVRWNGIMADENGDPIMYSVAQHSVIVSDLVNLLRGVLVPTVNWETMPSPALYGLMHDASEAYLCDIPRPLKAKLGAYMTYEADLMAEIIAQIGIPYNPAIKRATKIIDDRMIFWERDLLVGKPCVPYMNENEHPGGNLRDIMPDFRVWTPKEAKQRFLDKFAEIVVSNGNAIPADNFDLQQAINYRKAA